MSSPTEEVFIEKTNGIDEFQGDPKESPRREVIGVTLSRGEGIVCLLMYLSAMATLIIMFEVIKPSQLFAHNRH